jgi:hypothetical protein
MELIMLNEKLFESWCSLEKIWKLDANGQHDELLAGHNREAVLSDVLAYHELDQLPNGWTLTQMCSEDVVEMFLRSVSRSELLAKIAEYNKAHDKTFSRRDECICCKKIRRCEYPGVGWHTCMPCISYGRCEEEI